MTKLEILLKNYERMLSVPWSRNLAGAQKVWFAVYDKADERRLRARLSDFQMKTEKAGKTWTLCDVTNAFPEWMSANEYRESYFESPEDLELSMGAFSEHVAGVVKTSLNNERSDENSVVALIGVASLFGFSRISEVIVSVQGHIRGRLLVFFPGEYENNTYRLLDARDGWNYLAVPILTHDPTSV